MEWYALFVETGKEEYVRERLKFYFSEAILRPIVPRRNLTERKEGKVFHVTKTLFPGYVLIHTEMNTAVYEKIKTIPKFIRILSTGTCFSKVAEEEMLPILRLIGNNGVLEYSKVYLENSKVTVKSGPLQGLEGIIYRVDRRKHRAKIRLSFMNSIKTIDVGIEILQEQKSLFNESRDGISPNYQRFSP
jgi:transcriptional antiterminator NusG